MPEAARPAGRVDGVLLDIEGTTTPIVFVYDVLFPFARARLRPYLAAQFGSPALAPVLEQLARDHAADRAAGASPPPWPDSPRTDPDRVAAYLEWLMDRDRKAPGLKELQGRIWEEGYRARELAGQVFDDVPGALRRWREQGRRVFIYSSGSVLAQRLLFETTPHGDLTRLIDGYFDTTSGPKTSAASYRRIADAVGLAAPSLLFVSDVVAELDAARSAGCATMLSVRPGNRAVEAPPDHPVVRTFDEILP